MSAFSLDLRQRVLADCQAGGTYAAIARKYTVSAEWVRTFYKRFRETGEVAARSHATKRRPYHAPLVIDGALNGELFRAYVRQHLAPALPPGDLVVMDNLPSHKVAGVAEAVRGVGAELVYLPPYSPDLNPIEQVFAKAKAEIRRQKPRTVAATEALCGEAIDWFPSNECRRYIRHAGYGPQGSG